MENEELFHGIEWRLIVNFLTGEAAGEDRSRVEEWIKNNQGLQSELEIMRGFLKVKGKQELNVNKEKAWNDINSVIDKPQTPKRTFNIYPALKHAVKIAAVILILAGGYFGIKQFVFNSEPIKPATVLTEKVTQLGEKLHITLNDNSRIILNAGSKLKYENNFSGRTREVYLEGEAYFEIEHDTARPFIVHTKNISTTVLGTKFNVSSFAQDRSISISLVTGKVKVSKEETGKPVELVMLEPEQQLIYDKQTELSRVGNFDEQSVTGWKDNNLKFKKVNLADVLIKLERVYGIKFELSDKSYEKFKITGNFHDEPYSVICESLKKLTGLKYKFIKEENIIKKVVFYK
jgi:transmembrane sensor